MFTFFADLLKLCFIQQLTVYTFKLRIAVQAKGWMFFVFGINCKPKQFNRKSHNEMENLEPMLMSWLKN